MIEIPKLIAYDSQPRWLRELEWDLAITNGCFDVLTAGHVDLLKKAAGYDRNLLVLLNSDESVRRLKGDGRPINPAEWRAFVLSELKCVDGILIFDELRITEHIRRLAPDIWVKGGDYNEDSLDSDEVAAAREVGTRIEIIPTVFDISTTKILSKI